MIALQYRLGLRRGTRLLLLAALLLTLFYVGAFRHWDRRSEALNEALASEAEILSEKTSKDRRLGRINLARIRESLAAFQDSDSLLARESSALLRRVALAPAIAARMRAPFQHIDYVNETLGRSEELKVAFQAAGARIDTEALNAFPDYFSDDPKPGLLWARLEFGFHAAHVAAQSGVTALTSMSFPSTRPKYAPGTGPPFMEETPVRLRLEGSAEAIYQCLLRLPLTSDECASLDMPNAHPDKPALYPDQVMIKKASKSNPGAVIAEVTVIGLVYYGDAPSRGTSSANNE